MSRRVAPAALLAAGIAIASTACGGGGKPRPDLAFVSTRDGDYAIYAMNADGSRQTRLTPGTDSDTSSPEGLFFQTDPAWSPDGRQIAFASRRSGSFDLFVMNTDGTGTRRLTTSRDDETHPTWSPDGKRMAFARGDQGDLWVMNADGSGQRQITHDSSSELEPAWSPDGHWIVFVLKPEGFSEQELGLVRPDGAGARPLTSLPGSDNPSWSPDSRRVAFSSDAGPKGFEIYSVGVEGKGLWQVTSSPIDAFEPAWSPDGKKLAFVRDGAIVLANAGGGNETELTESKNNDSSPAWNPVQAAAGQ